MAASFYADHAEGGDDKIGRSAYPVFMVAALADFTEQVCGQLPVGIAYDPGAAADERASKPGAYVLMIRLGVPVDFSRGKARGLVPPGCYAYAGSAYGGGGMAARLRRHFRKEKRLHWHVDYLTSVADDLSALIFPDGCECALVKRLMDSGMFAPVLAGFGSSDCRRCLAHLVRLR